MLDPALETAIRARVRTAPFAALLGMELGSLGDGEAEVRLDVQERHHNPGRIAHGGVIAAMLDAAIGLALRTKLGMDATHVTMELHVNYLRPIATGTMIARGQAVHSGSRTGYGEGTLLDEEGLVLARGSATFLVVAGAQAAPGSDG